MTDEFSSFYADAYDLLYQDKDYAAECDLIERLFQRCGDGPIRRILDLGCGTGNHALPLARRGYEVVGVDRSEDMLAQARRKADPESDGRVVFYQEDLRRIDFHQQFNAALMMFAVLGYQLENADVLSALRAARQHLRPGGLLLLDVWYGPAVLRQKPSDRAKVIPTENGRILLVASGKLDVQRHLCGVSYHLWRLEGDQLIGETEETHWMRYFFPLELNLLLECSGFTPIRLGAFPEFDREPDETTWNAMAVARAV